MQNNICSEVFRKDRKGGKSMSRSFLDRFAARLDLMLPFHIFFALILIVASIYYIGVKGGMIVIGYWSGWAFLIGPGLFGVSMLLSIMVALTGTVWRRE